MSEVNVGYAVAAIAASALITMLTRWTPFLLFGGKRGIPKPIVYLGRVLPAAIMAALVVYCLKDANLASFSGGWAALICAAVVAALQIVKRNTLISIFVGTALYMVLIRVF